MFQRTRIPAFAIAFVTIRFSFLSGQRYSKFQVVKSSSVRVFPRISLQILKIVGQNCQTEKSSQVVEPSCRAEFFVPGIRRASQAVKSKLSWQGFCFVELAFLSGNVFNERKMS